MGLISDKVNERITEALLAVEKHTAEMATGLAQFQNGNRLTAARPLQVSGSPRLWGGSGRLVGWSLYADGGPVKLLIRDSRAAADGDVLAAFSLADGEDAVQWLGPGGVSFGEGVYLDKQAGSTGVLVGSVWLGAHD